MRVWITSTIAMVALHIGESTEQIAGYVWVYSIQSRAENAKLLQSDSKDILSGPQRTALELSLWYLIGNWKGWSNS
jgi:hypothetical protein